MQTNSIAINVNKSKECTKQEKKNDNFTINYLIKSTDKRSTRRRESI